MKRFHIFSFLLLILIAGSQKVYSQNITVTGRVSDATGGLALSGASVKVKGTNAGKSADDNGNYTIVAPGNGVLVVTFLGYASQEIPINNRTTINVSM